MPIIPPHERKPEPVVAYQVRLTGVGWDAETGDVTIEFGQREEPKGEVIYSLSRADAIQLHKALADTLRSNEALN